MYQKTLCALAVVFLLLNIWTLKDGHNWGGDFAQYIRHGQNIAEGRPYADRIELDDRAVSPPGFPLILAPFLKVFGLNFIVLKSLNVIFWFLFVFLAYRLMKEDLNPDFTFLGTLIFITSPTFFVFKQNVLSDVPFLFFVTAAVYFFTGFVKAERGRQGGGWFFYAALTCMGYAFLIRWAGVLLFAAAVLYVVFAKDFPKKRTLLGISGIFLFCLAVQSLFHSSAVYHAQELHVPFAVYLPLFLKQPSVVFGQMLEFFFPYLALPVVPLIHALKKILTWTGPFLLLVILWRVFKYRRTLNVSRWFCTLYLSGLIVWVLYSGSRYLLPVIPFVMIVGIRDYCAFAGRFRPKTRELWENGLKLFLALVIFNNVVVLVQRFGFNDDMIYAAQTKEMTQWLRENTGGDDRFMFSKPRVVGLLTGRMGAAYYRLEQGPVVCERVDRFGISYIITTKGIIERIDRDFAACPYTYQKMWGNEVYQIYKVVRPQAP